MQTSTRSVLLVDDDAGIRRMLRFVLRTGGFGITIATTGREALTSLVQDKIDLVILDLGLPDALGGEVLRWLHNNRAAGKGRPTWVVISALDEQDAKERYGPLGDHFLAKPFDPWKLIGLLDAIAPPSGR